MSDFQLTIYRHYAEHLRREGLTLKQAEAAGAFDPRVKRAVGSLIVSSPYSITHTEAMNLVGAKSCAYHKHAKDCFLNLAISTDYESTKH